MSTGGFPTNYRKNPIDAKLGSTTSGSQQEIRSYEEEGLYREEQWKSLSQGLKPSYISPVYNSNGSDPFQLIPQE
jgi:hypothetical protein